jgi:hypothetical protein
MRVQNCSRVTDRRIAKLVEPRRTGHDHARRTRHEDRSLLLLNLIPDEHAVGSTRMRPRFVRLSQLNGAKTTGADAMRA